MNAREEDKELRKKWAIQAFRHNINVSSYWIYAEKGWHLRKPTGKNRWQKTALVKFSYLHEAVAAAKILGPDVAVFNGPYMGWHPSGGQSLPEGSHASFMFEAGHMTDDGRLVADFFKETA